ncbi:cell division protein FtsQ/DivIB [Candidatus Pelagibacter sp.]|nr:cell division protein FtsQ/DivIB [Candidatus Pelagibacter sp.]
MHQHKSKKILIYFLLLFLVGSINNIELNKIRFNKIKDIKIIGLGNNNKLLKNKIENLDLGNLFFIKSNEIINIIDSNSLVESYEIYKKYPSSLVINIKKTKFLARINHNEKVFLIGSNGKLITNNSSSIKVPFIFGKPKINEFLDFKRIIDESKFSYEEINNLFFFSSKRWDVELHNNIIIKFPQSDVKESLKLISEFLRNQNFKGIEEIDARIKNQIILNGKRI